VGGASNATTTTVATTTTTLDPTRTAILAAYRASSSANYVAATHYPVDPTDGRLSSFMAGEELNRVRNELTVLAHLGRVLRGPPVDTSMATVKQVVGEVAVVADCDFDQTATIDGKTGQIHDPAPTRRTLINAEVDLMAGMWKVTRFSIVWAGCVASV
jgi:hypothetical protein